MVNFGLAIKSHFTSWSLEFFCIWFKSFIVILFIVYIIKKFHFFYLLFTLFILKIPIWS